ENGFTAVFPMRDSNYRLIGLVPKTLRNKEFLSFDDLRPYLTFNLGFPITERCCKWFSTYQLHHRMAEKFRSQRCFLIGDAAHIHSPVGGQGMNTGLQDAYNLAWKLAGVLEKKYPESILDTYAQERMPVAKRLLKTTDRLFTLVILQGWLVRKLKGIILPLLAKTFWKSGVTNRRLFEIISQTGIQYHDSQLSIHHSQSKKVKAGDRLPYIKFYDEKLKQDTDLHAWCKSAGFTLIIIGQLSQRDVLAIVKWIKLTYPSGLAFFYLPPSKRNQHLFDCFEIPENGRKALIVRPDMHIGYINDIVDIELLGGYLEGSIGWK
ncbi:MAG: FAD-dependent monooxygenase, partial [Sphingobacteriaceae bacterium]